jgi:hypothetical protein
MFQRFFKHFLRAIYTFDLRHWSEAEGTAFAVAKCQNAHQNEFDECRVEKPDGRAFPNVESRPLVGDISPLVQLPEADRHQDRVNVIKTFFLFVADVETK